MKIKTLDLWSVEGSLCYTNLKTNEDFVFVTRYKNNKPIKDLGKFWYNLNVLMLEEGFRES